MERKNILITGAGIAGPTLAYWLTRSGHKVTLVEKASAPRLGGQNIDISDAAIDIVRLMGIEKEILRHNTTEVGLHIVNKDNQVEAEFPKDAPLSFTSKYEILRGDLADILIQLTRSKVDYRFGDSIESLTQYAEGVEVVFSSKTRQRFDLLIVAEGVSSATRKMIVPDKNPYKYLGVYTSYTTIPRQPHDGKWARWLTAPKGRVLLLRPDNKGTTRASVNYWHDGPPEAHFSASEAVAEVQRKLQGVVWEEDRLMNDIKNDKDIYLGPVSQVRLQSWSKGRCCLLGDAAYCPTPFTGMGTTLAIIGAYVLAGELSRSDNYESAFREYESKLKPFVQKIQKVFPGQFRLVYPQSKAGVFIFNKVLSFFASKPVQKIAQALKKKPSETREFKLPHYQFATATYSYDSRLEQRDHNP
ncbi:FAD-dependent monooxygenase [Bdellovibrio sp. SKB1291214]|uniref:FAD-dependent monooxygenase n=1 Tax=Bdellovibrio sp. SKB1291214 TaxID=1732569 RepID=UPI0015955439|nr:FAD-dependent monooxygenase [Bdellovibrio sp. SKB1291214]UYL09445.1 FAD-dependent monooxygenase [Bdellovibrio sp. SKB1291214]